MPVSGRNDEPANVYRHPYSLDLGLLAQKDGV